MMVRGFQMLDEDGDGKVTELEVTTAADVMQEHMDRGTAGPRAPGMARRHGPSRTRQSHDGRQLTSGARRFASGRPRSRSKVMMNGYGMGFGGLWTLLILVLAGLAIAALIKYLWK